MAILKLIVFVLVIFINPSTSFYIPGVAPIEYQASQSVEIKVIFDFFKDYRKVKQCLIIIVIIVVFVFLKIYICFFTGCKINKLKNSTSL